MRTKRNTKSNIWIITLTVVFFCFGILLMAQYYTHKEEAYSLQNESPASLAMLVKTVNDNKQSLTSELNTLEQELARTQDLIASGVSLSTSIHSRIANLQIVTGAKEVTGPGISVTITGESNLQYLDIIDIVNELFVSGAEAVSINDIRFTMRSQISDEETFIDSTDANGNKYKKRIYVPMIDGKELLYPIVIKAIGDAATLETGLTYPGGIVDSLKALYMTYPTIKRVEKIDIAATRNYSYKYSTVPATQGTEANNN